MSPSEVDVLIIGAGFAGLRMLIEARSRGLRARVLEAGSDVGGTWYWNRYPGARTDTEAWTYCFSFDPELLQEWEWQDRYPSQREVQAYLDFVCHRHRLREDIEFNQRVTSLIRDSGSNTWTATTEAGGRYRATYVVAATGGIAHAYRPEIPDFDTFRGEWYMSAAWPKEGVDFNGKRVGIIGTGSTGVQLIPQIAQTAGHLTVFQRTPNFVLPARNHPLEEEQRKAIKRDYEQIWQLAHNQVFGFPIPPAGRNALDTPPEERRRILEEGWEKGGFRFIFETFDDLFVSEEANEIAAEFVRDKIRSIVHDPEVAERLCPTNHPLGTKRPPIGTNYYETYNRDNVTLVDLRSDPIERMVPNGIQTASGVVELEVLVFATGFKVGTGSLEQMDVRGERGVELKEVWRDGPQTLMGVGVAGFPNFFLIGGPHSTIGNAPPVAERASRWIGQVIEHLGRTGARAIEPTQQAMDEWAGLLQAIVDTTLLEKGKAANSWFFGANTPDGPNRIVLYAAGVPAYFDEFNRSEANGYPGFTFHQDSSEGDAAQLATSAN
ncbi:NAD(P)/FAD-dependent oxidoreductase [Mycolicibacterium thermoresistibile]